MASVRFVRNPAGFVEILRSAGVRADLERRAEAVKNAAESDASWDRQVSGLPGTETIPWQVRVETHGDRAVAQVVGAHPAALAVEAKHRVLGRAIDAAR